MRIFVTGASGFVGGHLIEAALRRRIELLGSSFHGRWRAGMSPGAVADVPLLAWDIRRPIDDRTADAIERLAPEVVLHLAGISIPGDCGTDEPTAEAIATNVQGTRHALALAERLARRGSDRRAGPLRFILASSCHVYANDFATGGRVDEGAPLAPASAYGRTKLAAERIVLERGADAATSNGMLDTLVVRGFQQTGPRQPARLILPEWIAKVRRGDRPLVVRCRATELDLIDVRDAVEMLLDLAAHPGGTGIVNLGSGRATSGDELIGAIERVAGETIPVVSERAGPRREPIADVTRLGSLVGPIRRRSLDTTVSDLWNERLDDSNRARE